MCDYEYVTSEFWAGLKVAAYNKASYCDMERKE